MPLTRYEVRNEYSLANPDLYRAAAKDDPDGLLEGVAMAGLVGIVRQLGDLAEFAAEVFHDLHEEVLATAARGHELLIRIQQLEAELPFVEKLMLAESNYVNFAYNPGLEWHANIQNEQNHFTQGDLPRFIRNAYKDCRGPPRLFLLDKFDVAGAGACLKRYTDPSFFRMEWASSELMKAEKEQQDKKARRIKKKARRQREMREAIFVGHMQPRIHPVPLEIKNAATSSNHVDNSNSQPSTDLDVLQTVPHRHEQGPESLNLLKTECDGSNLRLSHDPLLLLNGVSMESTALSRHRYLKSNETHVDAKSVSAEDHGKAEFVEKQKNVLPMNAKLPENVTDFTSGTDNYMDALTTIDSEGETDLDWKMPYEMNKGLKSYHVANRDSVLAKQVVPDHMRNIHKPEPYTENGVPNVQITCTEGDALEVDEPAHARSSDASFAEEKKLLFTDGDLVSDKSCASTPDSDSPPPLMPALDKLTVNAEELMQSESVNGIPETPETLAASNYDVRQPEPLSADLNQPPESVAPLESGSQDMFSEQVAAVSSYLEDKITEKPARELPRPHLDKAKFEDFQSDMSEGVKESSPHSSPDSSIQPMKWAMGSPRHPNITVDSDDELDGMQVSPPSLSSSNSALSSPRPSTLATTVFDNKPQYPVSPLMSSPESLGMPSPDSPISSVELGARFSLLPGHVQPASQIRLSSQKTGNNFLPEFKSSFPDFPVRDIAAESQESVLEEGPEEFPPPPPLPPLKWRTTRKFGGLMSSFNNVSDSSSRLPLPQKPLWRIGESPEMADLPPLACKVQLQHDDVLPVHGPSPASQKVSQGLSMSRNVLEEFENEDLYGSDTGPVSSEAPGIVLSEELSTVSGTVDDAVQFDIPFSLSMSLPLDVASIPGPEAAATVEHPRPKSIPFLQVNAPTQFVRSLSKGSLVDVRKKQDHTESVIYEDGIEEGSWNEISKTPETNVHVSVPHETSDDDHRAKSFRMEKQIPVSQRLEQVSRDLLPPLPSPSEGPVRTLRSSMIPKTNVHVSVAQETFDDDYRAKSFRMEKQIPVPQRLEQASRDLLPPLPSPSEGPVRTLRSSMIPKIERQDSLIAAIASHDKSTLRKVPEWSQSSRAAYPDERESLLEQIKTGSFSLRRTKTEKQEVSRPVTNINVAAILEKANAIRQAFVGSDDDDENDGWSDD